MEKIPISLQLPKKVSDLMDEKRGDTPKSRFIVRALEKYMGIPDEEATKYD